MHLTSRGPTVADFQAFFECCFYRVRHQEGLRHAMAHEWRVLLEEAATLSRIVEDEEREADRRLVGCGQVVFVTPAYARHVRSARAPGVNAAVVRLLPDGSRPFLCQDELRQAHAQGADLSILITRWDRADVLLGPDDQRRVQEYMNQVFLSLSRGYRLGEMLMPSTGETARRRAEAAGFRLRCDYAEHFRRNPPLPPPEDWPFLMGVTREEAYADDGSLISHFFVFTPPRFGFTPEEQAVLCQSLAGETAVLTADTLGLTVTTVKNRWRTIYEKVEQGHPTLWASLEDPGKAGDQRGKEKRRLLLNYLRDHPEELRPGL